MTRPAHRRDRGTALIVVLLVGLLVAAAGAGAWSAAAFVLSGARRRVALAQAGGVKLKFAKEKTKDGKDVTTITVV